VFGKATSLSKVALLFDNLLNFQRIDCPREVNNSDSICFQLKCPTVKDLTIV